MRRVSISFPNEGAIVGFLSVMLDQQNKTGEVCVMVNEADGPPLELTLINEKSDEFPVEGYVAYEDAR